MAGGGDVSGPGAAVTDNAIARWDTTSGTLIQNSAVSISDTGTVAGVQNLGLSGNILDSNGNELITLSQTASAVNQLTVSNAATGTNPAVAASGNNSNIGLDLQAKGTGAYRMLGTAATSAELRLFEDTSNGTNYTGVKAAANIGTSTTFTLPAADGSSGAFLHTNGAGLLSLTHSISNLSATGTGTTTISANTYTLVGGMSLTTPVAGTYLVTFSSSGTTTSANQTGSCGISIDGGSTVETGSVRDVLIAANAATSTIFGVASQIVVAVNGSQNIEVYFKMANNGSFTLRERSLTALRVA
jgi:hypothetical protein